MPRRDTSKIWEILPRHKRYAPCHGEVPQKFETYFHPINYTLHDTERYLNNLGDTSIPQKIRSMPRRGISKIWDILPSHKRYPPWDEEVLTRKSYLIFM